MEIHRYMCYNIAVNLICACSSVDRAPASGAGCVGSIPVRRTKSPSHMTGTFILYFPYIYPVFSLHYSLAYHIPANGAVVIFPLAPLLCFVGLLFYYVNNIYHKIKTPPKPARSFNLKLFIQPVHVHQPELHIFEVAKLPGEGLHRKEHIEALPILGEKAVASTKARKEFLAGLGVALAVLGKKNLAVALVRGDEGRFVPLF